MDGDSGLVEELEVFLEGSDVLYGTFFSTVVLYGHSEIIHDSFFRDTIPRKNIQATSYYKNVGILLGGCLTVKN